MPPKKEAPKRDYFADIMFYFLGAYILWVMLKRLGFYLEKWHIGSYQTIWGNISMFSTGIVWPFIKFLGLVFIAFAGWGMITSLRKLRGIIIEEKAIYGNITDANDAGVVMPMKNMKWERVIGHINSPNSSEWKLAIIEADIMLDDLLVAAGYRGDSLGERLKAVERSDFITIDYAWEAHKVRNQIAHQGAEFDLTEREAKRIISLYESVFKEFKMI